MDGVSYRRFYDRSWDFEEREDNEEFANAGPFKVLHSSSEIAKVIEGKVGGFYKCGEKMVCNTAAYQFIDDGRFNSLRLFTPKIPNGFLNAVVSYFQQDLSKEAIVNITYNKVLKRFFVRYPEAEETKAEKNYIIYNFRSWLIKDEMTVVQIHSHNTMPAFFSATDDADETIPGLYGVIGNLDRENPTMSFRFSGYGKKKPLQVQDLFKEVTSYAD